MPTPRPFKPTVMKMDKLRLLLYGENGCGKTHLAHSMPGKKVFVNYSGNLETLLKFPQTDWTAVDGPDDWPGIHTMFTDPYFDQFDSVILDNATGLYRVLIQTALKLPMQTRQGEDVRVSPEMPSLRDYSLAAERLRVTLNLLLERAEKQHVCCIFHVLVVQDKEGNIQQAGPSAPGQVPAHVLSGFAEQLYMKMDSTGIPTVHFVNFGAYPATTRFRLTTTDRKPVRDLNLEQFYKPLLTPRAAA